MIDRQADVDRVTQTLDELLQQATKVVTSMNRVLLRSQAQASNNADPKAETEKDDNDAATG